MPITVIATVDPTRSRVEARTEHAQLISMDADPPMGDDSAAGPKEALLAALAGCTAMDVASLLRKKRQAAESYEIEVSGETAEAHPRVFTVHQRRASRRWCRRGGGAASIDRAVRDALLPGERDALGRRHDRASVPAHHRRDDPRGRGGDHGAVRTARSLASAGRAVTTRC